MSAQNDESQGIVFGTVGLVLTLVIALLIGIGLHTKSKHHAPKAPATPAAAPAPVAVAAAHTAEAHAAVTTALPTDAASISVANGVVKFYFAPAKAEIAAGANDALVDVVKAVAAGKKVSISGFNDPSGDAAKNAELSKQRAFAVRDALVALGVANDKIELKKPENATVSGAAAEARRVEVSVH